MDMFLIALLVGQIALAQDLTHSETSTNRPIEPQLKIRPVEAPKEVVDVQDNASELKRELQEAIQLREDRIVINRAKIETLREKVCKLRESETRFHRYSYLNGFAAVGSGVAKNRIDAAFRAVNWAPGLKVVRLTKFLKVATLVNAACVLADIGMAESKANSAESLEKEIVLRLKDLSKETAELEELKKLMEFE